MPQPEHEDTTYAAKLVDVGNHILTSASLSADVSHPSALLQKISRQHRRVRSFPENYLRIGPFTMELFCFMPHTNTTVSEMHATNTMCSPTLLYIF